VRINYRAPVENASEVEAEAIWLLYEHGEYTEADYEADALELDDRRRDIDNVVDAGEFDERFYEVEELPIAA